MNKQDKQNLYKRLNELIREEKEACHPSSRIEIVIEKEEYFIKDLINLLDNGTNYEKTNWISKRIIFQFSLHYIMFSFIIFTVNLVHTVNIILFTYFVLIFLIYCFIILLSLEKKDYYLKEFIRSRYKLLNNLEKERLYELSQ